jgi:hypothetical protein
VKVEGEGERGKKRGKPVGVLIPTPGPGMVLGTVPRAFLTKYWRVTIATMAIIRQTTIILLFLHFLRPVASIGRQVSKQITEHSRRRREDYNGGGRGAPRQDQQKDEEQAS